MTTPHTSLKILIGLPIVLGVATGIGFTAAWLDDSLENSAPAASTENATSSDDASKDATTLETDEYDLLVDDLVTQLEATWTGTTHRAVALGTVSALCWLDTTPSALTELPAGRVREEWSTMLFLLQEGNGRTTVCPYVSAADSASAQAAWEVDQDEDGLRDLVERWYGTSPTQADTDGDGFQDLEELTNGFSPLKDE